MSAWESLNGQRMTLNLHQDYKIIDIDEWVNSGITSMCNCQTMGT